LAWLLQAHRTHIVRNLKNLEGVIGLSVVDPYLGEKGWRFTTETPGAIPDTVNNAAYLSELYLKANPNYEGRFTVPVLWDKQHGTIVNNESSEIIRMLNENFDEFTSPSTRGLTFYPEPLREEIDQFNEWVYKWINNGVYKSGFAQKQEAYEEHCANVFRGLDQCERILSEQDYLVGNTFTDADIRLFTTTVRFDPVYAVHFKCNLKSIAHDYPNILRWARRIYQKPKVASTVNMMHIKTHYYKSHRHINPFGIVPLGNGPDLSAPIE